MSLGNNVGTFLWNVAEEKDGFKFGKPWKQSNKSLGLVIPILREKDIKREYVMLEETKNITIEDTGSIDKVRIINKGDQSVFIRSGVILAGDTQERAVVSSVIIMPNTTEEVEVKCVHASKGIRSGTKMKAKNYAPPVVLSALYSRNQGKVWNSVQQYSSHMRNKSIGGFHTLYSQTSGGPRLHNRRIGAVKRLDSMEDHPISASSDDLIGTIEEVELSKKSIDEAIKDIPVMKHQVGAIIFDASGIVGFEVFDSAISWKALHKKVISKYGDVLQKEQEEPLFELKEEVIPKKIRAFVEDIMKSDEKKSHESKIATTIFIDGTKIVGEYTEANGGIVHVIAFKR